MEASLERRVFRSVLEGRTNCPTLRNVTSATLVNMMSGPTVLKYIRAHAAYPSVALGRDLVGLVVNLPAWLGGGSRLVLLSAACHPLQRHTPSQSHAVLMIDPDLPQQYCLMSDDRSSQITPTYRAGSR
ncbi:hypothetical protein J6590_036799 [Homalodisca vitripennis]|nr:hypothetical protein J6590_036799 [Homalodisca vitripennis]